MGVYGMANQEQLDILKQGVEVWNTWRKEHLDIRPDLINANLHGAYLREISLTEANLSKADLTKADLRGANLKRASLCSIDFTNADLYTAHINEANLSDANLNGANLSYADLNNTDLRGARLISTNLSRTNLSGANLIGSRIGLTIFGEVDLRTVVGLDTVEHVAPSTIGIDTIYRSQGNIPETFLRNAGAPDSFIEYMRSLVSNPIDYYSCFISYSSKDEAFSRRLHADLQSHNVRCWFAPEDLKWGARIRIGIDEAIRLHDKLLLILSKSSVVSGWVEREVQTALANEKKEKKTILFPVRVDGAVFDCPYDWATEIRHERNIGDFTRWKSHDEYQKSFNRLLHDLKSETKISKE